MSLTDTKIPEARTAAHDREQSWSRAAFALTTVGWGANQFAPMVVLYRERLGISASAAEAVFGLYAAGLVPGLLIAGPLSDRVGRPALRGRGAADGPVGLRRRDDRDDLRPGPGREPCEEHLAGVRRRRRGDDRDGRRGDSAVRAADRDRRNRSRRRPTVAAHRGPRPDHRRHARRSGGGPARPAPGPAGGAPPPGRGGGGAWAQRPARLWPPPRPPPRPRTLRSAGRRAQRPGAAAPAAPAPAPPPTRRGAAETPLPHRRRRPGGRT